MTVLTILGILVAFLILCGWLFVWSLCRVAAQADAQLELGDDDWGEKIVLERRGSYAEEVDLHV